MYRCSSLSARDAGARYLRVVPIAETRDLTEYILIELDKEGGLVSITVEHATKQTNVHEFSYQEIAR